MRRTVTNRNEKSKRNKEIYEDRKEGSQIVEIANKFNISIPRVHRIVMQEENKHLKAENEKLKSKLEDRKKLLNSLYGEKSQ